MKKYTYLFAILTLLFNCSSEDDGTNDPNNLNPGPFSVTILETRMDGANIEWTDAIDIDDDPVTYSIYLEDELISIGGTALSYNFTGLEPEISYDGYILADDGNGGTSQTNFFFVTEPEVIILTVEATYWTVNSFPEAGGTRFVYGCGFIVPHYEDASSYQIEVINYRYDDYPYFVGSVFSWTNESQSSIITYVPEEDSYRVYMTGASVNTVNPAYDDFYNNVTGVIGEAQIIITLSND